MPQELANQAQLEQIFSPSVSTHVPVSSLADFPTPSGGIITLADNTSYEIIGTVDISPNRIVAGVRNLLTGVDRFNDKLISDTTGALLTCDSSSVVKSSFSVQSLTLQAANGSLLDFVSSSQNQSFAGVELILGACVNFGTVQNARTFILRNTSLASNTGSGFAFSGALGGKLLFFDNSSTNVVGTTLALGTAVFDTIIIGRCSIVKSVGDTFISGGSNVTIAGIITSCTFSGAGTFASGFNAQSTNWLWRSNMGVTNTLIPASQTSGFATVATTGAYSDLTGRPTLGTMSAVDDAPSDSQSYSRNNAAWVVVSGSGLTQPQTMARAFARC